MFKTFLKILDICFIRATILQNNPGAKPSQASLASVAIPSVMRAGTNGKSYICYSDFFFFWSLVLIQYF